MKINQLKAGVILSNLSIFIGSAISIMYTPIMLRLLGQSEYGLYQLVYSVVSYLGLLSFGFGAAYMRYYSRYKAENDALKVARLNGMFMAVFSIIGVVALISGSILVRNVDCIFQENLTKSELETAGILMTLLVVNLAISFPFSVFNSYVTANEQYLFQRTLSIVKTILNPFVVLPVLLMGYKSIGMVVVTVGLNIISEVAIMMFSLKKLKMTFKFDCIDKGLLKEIAVFSSFIFLNIIVDQINWNVDKVLLGMYQGTVSVAVYGLASQLNGYYISFSTSVSTVFIPRVHRLIAEKAGDRALTELFIKIGRIQFMILMLILTGLIFFGKPFITMWAGADYEQSFAIALMLIAPVTIPLIQNVGIEIQRAKNMHKFRSWTYFFIAIINIVISIPLCKFYGGIGCAIGTALSLLIGNGLLMNIYYHKKIGIDVIRFWKEILQIIPGMIPAVIFAVAMLRVVNLYHIFGFIVCGLLYTFVFCLGLWLFGMNDYEKTLIPNPLKKLQKHR